MANTKQNNTFTLFCHHNVPALKVKLHIVLADAVKSTLVKPSVGCDIIINNARALVVVNPGSLTLARSVGSGGNIFDFYERVW